MLCILEPVWNFLNGFSILCRDVAVPVCLHGLNLPKKNDIKMEVLFWVALVIAIQVRWSIILKLPKQITVHLCILNTHQASDLLQPPLAFAELISEYALAPLYFISVFHFHDDFRADSNSRDKHGWMDGFFVVENAVCTLRVMLFVTMHCWATSYIADKMIIW